MAAANSIRMRIETERRQLQRASALLACLSAAFDAGRDIEYSDVADVARELVGRALDGLDSARLHRPPEP